MAADESGAQGQAGDTLQIVYISGPISGRPNLNRPAFDQAAKVLAAAGYQVVNPFDVCPNPASWEEAMRADVKALMDCDRILMLPGWEESRGAVIEAWIAAKLGITRLCPKEAYAEWEAS